MHVNNSIFTQVAFKRNDCLNPQKNINTLVNSNNHTLFNLQKAITVALHLTGHIITVIEHQHICGNMKF